MWLCVVFFVAFLSVVPADAKAPSPVKDCNEFFLNKRPPWFPGILEKGQVLNQDRYKVVCQTFRNERRFFTLYDTESRIPLFSAYRYTGNGDAPEREGWYTEPQLEGNGMWDGTYRNQAGPKDYSDSGTYNRGRLFPFSHGFNEYDRLSTNTLTNIVPLVETFNEGSWADVETCTKCVLDELCINDKGHREGFVVVGARPSNENQLNHRVNIPDLLWSAFCCYNKQKKKWLASAYWGENKNQTSDYLRTRTLNDLKLKIGPGLVVFEKSKCPSSTTVEEFYPQLKASCRCLNVSLDPGPHQPLPAQPDGEQLFSRTPEDSKNNQQEGKPMKVLLDPKPFQPLHGELREQFRKPLLQPWQEPAPVKLLLGHKPIQPSKDLATTSGTPTGTKTSEPRTGP